MDGLVLLALILKWKGEGEVDLEKMVLRRKYEG